MIGMLVDFLKPVAVDYELMRSSEGLERKSIHVTSPSRQSRRSIVRPTPGKKQKDDSIMNLPLMQTLR